MAYPQQCVAVTEKLQTTHETDQMLRSSPRQEGRNEIHNLEIRKEIKPGRTLDMRNPLELVSVGDGIVILVDKKLKYLQRINTEGELFRKYQINLNEEVYYRSASVYGDYLFVARSDNEITKMLLEGSDDDITYKPEEIGEIDYISATRENVILITERGYNGRVLKYDTQTNKVEKIVGDIWSPGKVSVVQVGHDTKYIVKCLQSGQRVNIYNRFWSKTSTIDKNCDVLTVTPGGKLVLVYDNRIHEYSQDGRFIRKLLDKHKFKIIQDITCDGHYLFVLERNPYCIKVFESK